MCQKEKHYTLSTLTALRPVNLNTIGLLVYITQTSKNKGCEENCRYIDLIMPFLTIMTMTANNEPIKVAVLRQSQTRIALFSS